MSTAPRDVRLTRFLAVVASALFIVLMLGTGSHADQPLPGSFSSACFGRILRKQSAPPTQMVTTVSGRGIIAQAGVGSYDCWLSNCELCCGKVPGRCPDDCDYCEDYARARQQLRCQTN